MESIIPKARGRTGSRENSIENYHQQGSNSAIHSQTKICQDKTLQVQEKITEKSSNSIKISVVSMGGSIQKDPEEDKECAICLDVLQDVYPLVCRHRFHKKCIQTWLRENDCCPMCRKPVDLVFAHHISKFRIFVSHMGEWAIRAAF